MHKQARVEQGESDQCAGLSERQGQVLDYIQTYQQRRGYAPSLVEIGQALGMSSKSVVSYHLKRLEQAGCIERTPRISRGIRLLASA
jgi:repressor LexA